MTNISIFENPEFGTLRTMEMPDGQIGFVGKDVASMLGYKNTRDAISTHVDEEDKTTVAICDTGSNYKSQAVIINESAVYALIFGSKLPKAREFKHWVTSVVLPQIRQTGGYIPVDKGDDEQAILAKALLISQRTIETQKAQLEAQKPQVQFAKSVKGSVNSILIGNLAKLIASNGVEIGQNRLFEWLRDNNYIGKTGRHRNIAYQRYVEKGYFELEENIVEVNNKTFVTVTTLVTGAGQEYFVNGFVSGKFVI